MDLSKINFSQMPPEMIQQLIKGGEKTILKINLTKLMILKKCLMQKTHKNIF